MASEPTQTSAKIPTLLCLLLCAGLVYQYHQGTREAERHAAGLEQMSKSLRTASQKLEEQRQVNQTLEQNLAEALNAKTNAPPSVAAPARTVEVIASASPKAEMGSVPRIQQREEERDDLSGKITDMSRSMCDLQTRITETQRRLDASEGDREALLREMKRLQTQKAKLEDQFFNLAALREQIHRLRAEQAVSRRLDWIRRGVYGQVKGSAALGKVASARSSSGNYNLDVEVHQGAAKVLAPAN